MVPGEFRREAPYRLSDFTAAGCWSGFRLITRFHHRIRRRSIQSHMMESQQRGTGQIQAAMIAISLDRDFHRCTVNPCGRELQLCVSR